MIKKLVRNSSPAHYVEKLVHFVKNSEHHTEHLCKEILTKEKSLKNRENIVVSLLLE